MIAEIWLSILSHNNSMHRGKHIWTEILIFNNRFAVCTALNSRYRYLQVDKRWQVGEGFCVNTSDIVVLQKSVKEEVNVMEYIE